MKLTFERDDLLYVPTSAAGCREWAGIPCLLLSNVLIHAEGARLSAWRQTWKSASE